MSERGAGPEYASLESIERSTMVQTEPFAEPMFRWGDSLEEGSELAEREGKLVLLDLYSPT